MKSFYCSPELTYNNVIDKSFKQIQFLVSIAILKGNSLISSFTAKL